MRRVAVGALLLAAAVVLVLVLTGVTGGGKQPYQVRAIFDNASAAVQGEDVRIAGAPVGTIASLGVTADKQAAVTLEIDRSSFTPWYSNATCAIRVQSLIGEKYVDCSPGTSNHAPLQRVQSGPGKGSYLLPVTHTTSPVDFDIVQNIYQEPVREQFSLILNELGTGLAARGSDLNAVIHRADPALGYTDQVLKILARQNRQLAQLSTDSNQVLRPLAKARRELAGFIVHANTTAVASASRAADIARSFQLLPSFLRQLRPLMADLGSLADQGTPVFSALNQAAPAIDRQYEELAPFARAARRSLIDLGSASAQQQPLLLAATPLAKRLLHLGNASVPTAASLDRLLSSLQNTGGIQQLMALLFYGTEATNGFDAEGHYVRTQSLFGGCTAYAKVPAPGCSANFTHAKAAADAAIAALPRPSSRAASESPRIRALIRSARAAAKRPAVPPALSGLLRYLIGTHG